MNNLRFEVGPLARRIVVWGALVAPMVGQAQEVSRVDALPSAAKALPVSASGRVVPLPDGSLLRQWPGTYFETAFTGREAFFRVGIGEVSLRVRVDGGAPVAVVKPAPGVYRVAGLGDKTPHMLRVDVASESQAGATIFGGFFTGAGANAAATSRRTGQFEFVGDSQTVGYGNTSGTRQCSEADVWATTDATQGVGPSVAAHYDAGYEVNAISGRGAVRNYGGFAADTLLQAYPDALFDKDKRHPADDSAWHPQLIAVNLGTNDFSTPLHAGESWKSRDELHAAFEAAYGDFIKQLHARQPQAYIVMWAVGAADSEIQVEVAKVADKLRGAGIDRLGLVPVTDLTLTGCNYHPSVADDRHVADLLIRHLDAHPGAVGSGSAVASAQPAASATVRHISGQLINAPQTATWNVFGTDQRTELLPHDGPKQYPTWRVKVGSKGANAWDVGAVSALTGPVSAGDAVMAVVYLRAPELKDGEKTSVSYFGVNEASAPYDMIARGTAEVTNQWTRFYAVGKSAKSYAAAGLNVGVHLASDKHVIDLGPVQVYDFGPNVDPAVLLNSNK